MNRSIANGVYSLVLNTSAVTSEADPSLPAADHNPDLFFRLYGDADGNGTVDSTNEYNQFAQSMSTYNPIFDYFDSGTSNNADYTLFKKDMNLVYAGTISFNPAALRPTNLAAADDGPTSVTLSWTGPSDPTVSGYTVQRWSDIDPTWTTLPGDPLPATPDTFTDTTALPGHTYEYALAAQTSAGLASDWSLPSNDAITPMPTTLVALWTNAGQVSLAWDAVPGATGYTVYRQGPGDAGFAPVTAQPQSGTTYVDSGLASDAAYSYRVAATLPAGQSGPGNTVTARTLSRSGLGNEMFWDYSQAPQEADAAPANVADAGGATVGLQFTPDFNGYVTAVQFYKGPLNTGPHTADLWDSFNDRLATATFTDESQSGWQQVDFAQPVYAVGGETYTASDFGTSGYLADDEGYFDSGPGVGTLDTQAPALGNGVEALGSTDARPLGSDGANYWVQPVFFYPPATGDSGLTPPNPTATAVSDSRIRLTWTGESSSTTAVTVQISGPADGGTFSDLEQVPAGHGHCDVTGLLAGTAYSFRLVATNPGGQSSPSGAVTVSTLPVPAPTGLTAIAVSESRIDLNWTDDSAGETGFTIQRSADGSSGWTTLLPSVAPGMSSFRDIGVTQGRTYYYRVDATDAAGTSQFSNVASASTPYSVATVAVAATAAQTTVTGTTDALSVLGAITGGPESDLNYIGSVTSGPAGATFSPNGTNAAKNSTIAFTAAGTYTIQATIQNGPYSVTSSVQVIVDRTATSIAITPSVPLVVPGATQQLSATVLAQFGVAMDPPPEFVWSIVSGNGNVDQTGLFTAPSTPGESSVEATSGGLSGAIAVISTDVYRVTHYGNLRERRPGLGRADPPELRLGRRRQPDGRHPTSGHRDRDDQ
jgi:hypothetical protein